MIYILRNKKGSSLLELILVFALIALLLPVLIGGLTTSEEGNAQQAQKFLAINILKETTEAVKNIEANSWSSISNDGIYHPVISQNKWTLSPGSYTLNGLTTSMVVGDIYRDTNNAIVTVGGILDNSTKSIISTVSWNTPFPSSLSITTYAARFRNNLIKLSTTTADFNLGSPSGTTISDTIGSSIPGDGEISLGTRGHGGNWCSPAFSSTTVDLPKNGVANGVWAVQGKVSAVTGDNASGVSFANVLVNDSYPPTASIAGTLDGYKTNGVWIDGNYAYITTDDHIKEVDIIDLNQLNPVTKKYTEVGYFNVPGNSSGKSVYVLGTIGYVVSSNTLYSFDLTSKVGSRPQLGSISLAGTGVKVYVIGSYAYVATASLTTQLQIIQVSNGGATLAVVGQAGVNGLTATDLTMNAMGTRAYVTTGVSATKPEFFIIDTSVKTGNRPVVGSYDSLGMNPNGVALTPGNRAILVGTGGEEYQVINITDETAPVLCGGIDVPTGVNGVSSVLDSTGSAYSYVVTGDSSSELKIIEGPGGEYATSGTYTSAPITATTSASFNSFLASVAQPISTTIKMQVAVATAVSGNCTNANYTFVGPDVNNPTTSYFLPNNNIIQGEIPFFSVGLYNNPGNCFEYKIFMTTGDYANSPVFSNVTVNFTP